MEKVIHRFVVLVAALGFISGMTLADQNQKFSDPMERSLEAGAVTLIQSSNGSVVEVRVEGCELCSRQSYLPKRNIEVQAAGESVTNEDYPKYSGQPGTIVFNEKDFMIMGVYFWSSVPREFDR